jgi:predicted signal transduction protein with EAL and GGDEF domain
MKKKTTHGLKLDQLADLLSIGIDEADFLGEISDDDAMSDMLRERLITSLPRNASLLDSLMVIMGKMGYRLQPLEGRSLAEVLLSADTDIALLKAIKTYGKKLSFTMEEGNEKAVAVTMYQAAIASALVHHGQLITTSSYDAIERSLTIMSKKKWMTPELSDLFLQARDICREKGKE